MKHYVIPENQLRNLLYDAIKYRILKDNGAMSWEWYCHWCPNKEHGDLEETVKTELKNYQIIFY